MLESPPAEASKRKLEPLVARYADVAIASSPGAPRHPPGPGSQHLVNTTGSDCEVCSVEKTVKDKIEEEIVTAYAEKQRRFEVSHR